MSTEKFDIPQEMKSSLIPEIISLNTKVKFRCHKNISCYNACCKEADITLTPYDIVRMRQNLGLSSEAFLKNYTVPFEMDQHGTPGVKMRTDNEGACIHMREEGCAIYEDRPSACRYYGLGVMARKDVNEKEDHYVYFRNKEDICKGWDEDFETTVADYRKDQDVEIYDLFNRDWMQLMLKKKSGGYAVGKPSEMSMQVFFMASYDLDRFKRFITSPAFSRVYIVDQEEMDKITSDDLELMKFGARFLRHVLFAEKSLQEVENAYEKRYEDRKEVIELRTKAEVQLARQKEEDRKREALKMDDEVSDKQKS